MGKFFKMSYRYDKKSYSDFGLAATDNGNTYVLPEDGTVWIPCLLYDFGWGEETGYYRSPLPEYNQLLEIVLEEQTFEDVYGAAAIIMKEYPERLLPSCEEMISSVTNQEKISKLAEIFQLYNGINRSRIVGKSYKDIFSEACRWTALAEQLKKLNKYKGSGA